jgi:hypothetical protein
MVVIPSKMGRLNKRALLECLHRMGTASRAGLAKSVGLSQPTAGKIVDALIKMDVVEEVDGLESDGQPNARTRRPIGRVGRPGRMLRLNRVPARFLAVQLGIEETSFAKLPVGVTEEDRWELDLPTGRSALAWQGQLRKAADRIQQKDFWGVLISVPGIVDENKARVLFSPNLHWTEGEDLTRLVREVWDSPVVLVQEERALALGHKAVNPSNDSFLLVDLGEGVGGAVISEGKL